MLGGACSGSDVAHPLEVNLDIHPSILRPDAIALPGHLLPVSALGSFPG